MLAEASMRKGQRRTRRIELDVVDKAYSTESHGTLSPLR